MTRWEILEKAREVFEGKSLSYGTYEQVREIVDAIVELEDPHKQRNRKT